MRKRRRCRRPSPRARNSAIRSGTHPLKEALCAAPGTTTCQFAVKWRAIAAPLRGGVTGSCSPDTMRAGASDVVAPRMSSGRPAGQSAHRTRQLSAYTVRKKEPFASAAKSTPAV